MRPLRFPGAATTSCTLTDGTTHDLNVMTNQRTHTATMEFTTVGTASATGTLELAAGPAESVLGILIDGAADVDGQTLDRWDALRVDGAGSAAVVATGATLAVIRMRRA